MRTRLRKLHDDGLPTLASVYPEGVGVTVEGLGGGQPGGSVRGVVLDPAGNVVHDCGTGELVTLTRTDQIVEVQLAGGAGFRRSAGAIGGGRGGRRGGGIRFGGRGAEGLRDCVSDGSGGGIAPRPAAQGGRIQ